MNDVTLILSAIEQGDPHAAEQLLPLIYDELRKLAGQKLAQEKPGQTLDATALVHEAYLRLVVTPGRESGSHEPHWNSRGHFFAAAAEAMRRILIDNARRKKTEKLGGDRQRLSLANIEVVAFDDAERWLQLDDALTLCQGRSIGCSGGQVAAVCLSFDRRNRRGSRNLSRHRLSSLDVRSGMASVRTV